MYPRKYGVFLDMAIFELLEYPAPGCLDEECVSFLHANTLAGRDYGENQEGQKLLVCAFFT